MEYITLNKKPQVNTSIVALELISSSVLQINVDFFFFFRYVILILAFAAGKSLCRKYIWNVNLYWVVNSLWNDSVSL